VEHGLPIASSKGWNLLKSSIEDWMGWPAIEFHQYDSKYPDAYQGYYEFQVEYNGKPEVETVKVYVVDSIEPGPKFSIGYVDTDPDTGSRQPFVEICKCEHEWAANWIVGDLTRDFDEPNREIKIKHENS
jgi:hypothetical protein